ncbi:MAG: ABC transporter permease, partial [Acidobacteria bacterium]|nr:ABC transporter permease [Acidobacteriota bacterium]
MSLARFAVGRLASGAVFALVVASLTLLLARMVPGDPASDERLRRTPEEVAALRA